jgi:hypothetical protein
VRRLISKPAALNEATTPLKAERPVGLAVLMDHDEDVVGCDLGLLGEPPTDLRIHLTLLIVGPPAPHRDVDVDDAVVARDVKVGAVLKG